MPKVNLVILITNCLPGLLLGTYNSEINKRRVQCCLIKREPKWAVSPCPQVGWQHLLSSTLGVPSCPSPLQAKCLVCQSWGSLDHPVCPTPISQFRMLQAVLGSPISYSSGHLTMCLSFGGKSEMPHSEHAWQNDPPSRRDPVKNSSFPEYSKGVSHA